MIWVETLWEQHAKALRFGSLLKEGSAWAQLGASSTAATADLQHYFGALYKQQCADAGGAYVGIAA